MLFATDDSYAIGEFAQANRGNRLVDPNCLTGRVGVTPPTWLLNPSGSVLTAAIVGIRQIGPFRAVRVRISGTAGAGSDEPSIRFTDLSAAHFAAVAGNLFTVGVCARLVDGSLANVTTVFLHCDTFDASHLYVSGDYDGTSRLAQVGARQALHKSLLSRSFTVAGGTVAFANFYLSFQCTPSAAVDFTVEIAMPFAAVK